MADIVLTRLRGVELLRNPFLSKGTAFTAEERSLLGLHGLLPEHVSTADEQMERVYRNFTQEETPVRKFVFLCNLMSRSELLFFQFAAKHASEVLPFIYTPTVGEGAIHYSLLFREAKGLYLAYPGRDEVERAFEMCEQKDVEVIVMTDGERILGLGDQGVGGMVIPVGKLALYTLFGGIHPMKTLPIVLDVGTNNEERLRDPLYLGWRNRRVGGAEYDAFVDRVVKAVKKRYPKAVLQWEDFAKQNASRLLEKYRKEVLSFNDDIQGTAAVTLAGLMAAVKVIGGRLGEQRIAILGGGSAGTGVASLLVHAMEREGLSVEEGRKRIFIVDREGLIWKGMKGLDENQKLYAHDEGGWPLAEVVKRVHPTILIGVSGQGGAFTKEVLEEMARHVARPIVFPLSNPTPQAEAKPEDVMNWTGGKALIATGSPFGPVSYGGKSYGIGQCNNVYIFPGFGLGLLAAGAKWVPDALFYEAASVLASVSPALQEATAPLYPLIPEVRAVSRQIARAVALKAIEMKLATQDAAQVEARLEALMWTPAYPQVRPA